MRFLIDTGANIPVLLVALKNKRNKSKFTLYAAMFIAIYGQKLLQLNFGLRRNFQWPFYLAEISKLILNIDF